MQINTMLFIGGIGTGEIVLILAGVLIFFGAKKIPELAKGLGKGIKEFKDASKEVTSELERNIEDKKSEYKTEYKAELKKEDQV